MNLLKTFSATKLRLLVILLVSTVNFPGVTEKFLIGFRDWLMDPDNFDWLLGKRDKWENTKPLEELDDSFLEPDDEPYEDLDTSKEIGRYHGRHNGDRPMWYFNLPMKDYPQQFLVVIAGCVTIPVMSHNGIRLVHGSTIIKQSDVQGRGMAIITGANCRSEECYIEIVEETKEHDGRPAEAEGLFRKEEWTDLKFVHNKSFTWLRPGYKGTLVFYWPEIDYVFVVPDGSKDFSPEGHSHETFFCGTNNSPEESNGTKASIFGPAGKELSKVIVYFD